MRVEDKMRDVTARKRRGEKGQEKEREREKRDKVL